MNHEEAHGKLEQLKGRAKQSIGAATGNEELEAEGAVERVEGAVEEGLGTASRKLGELVDDVADAVRK